MNSVSRIFCALPAAALLIAALGIAPTAAADAPITWLGVTLGAPVASLRESKGDPMVVTRYPDVTIAAGQSPPPGTAPQRKARYWLGGTIFLIVTEQRGHVVGLDAYAPDAPDSPVASVAADPLGARLGQTIQQPDGQPIKSRAIDVKGPAGVRVRYELENGRINSIQWDLTPEAIAALPGDDLPPIAEALGDAFRTAILDAQPNETTGARWEYIYLALHKCDGDTRWKSKGQSLGSNGGRTYDILHAVCPTTKAERDFFFDITPYFGK
jgi:hypothetical protein